MTEPEPDGSSRRPATSPSVATSFSAIVTCTRVTSASRTFTTPASMWFRVNVEFSNLARPDRPRITSRPPLDLNVTPSAMRNDPSSTTAGPANPPISRFRISVSPPPLIRIASSPPWKATPSISTNPEGTRMSSNRGTASLQMVPCPRITSASVMSRSPPASVSTWPSGSDSWCPLSTRISSTPGRAFASMTAARSEQSPLTSAHKPSPGSTSTVSSLTVVLSTVPF